MTKKFREWKREIPEGFEVVLLDAFADGVQGGITEAVLRGSGMEISRGVAEDGLDENRYVVHWMAGSDIIGEGPGPTEALIDFRSKANDRATEYRRMSVGDFGPIVIGDEISFFRLFQGRTIDGKVMDVIGHKNNVYYLVDFGEDEFVELCVRSADGHLESSVSGMRMLVKKLFNANQKNA